VQLTVDTPQALVDRRAECARLDRLLTNARTGTSAAAVMRGEVGVGKSALLDYLLANAAGCLVVRAAGVESEMELPFAVLHQLCAPLLNRLERLPAPQRGALGTAFGLASGPAPDRFLVGVAALGLLSDIAETQPLICLVDDAQWLDRASAQVLGFVARRLAADSVVLIFAARASIDTPDLAGLPELTIGPLSDPDARAVLESAITGKLDESVRDRILAEARGNPLALLELARAWTPMALAGGFGLPDNASVSAKIEEVFRRHLTPLPDDTRRLLLVAAADPVGDPVLILAAAERVGIPAEAAEPAIASGLLHIGSQVRFRHPLVRSVVYREAPLSHRRAVHGALAEVTDPKIDPDRRAWHLAASASGPDEDIAAELERSATRAQARGGLAAAAAFLERAVALTDNPARRAERALVAAEVSFQAGAFDAAQRLLTIAEEYPLDEFGAARADLLRGHIAVVLSYGSDAAPLLLRAAKRLEPFNLELAREAYLTAWGAAVIAGDLGEAGLLLEICRAIRALPPPPTAAHPLHLVLDGLALLTTDGRAVATPALQRAAKAVAEMPVEDVLRWGWLAGAPSAATWDSDGISALYERLVQLLRDAGALAALPLQLNALGGVKALKGDFEGAGLLIAESDRVAAATGSHVPPFADVTLRARQGREPEASALIEAAIKQAVAGGQSGGAMSAQFAAAVLYNGLARYERAASAASQVTAKALDPWNYVFALPELVEAAARTGDLELARNAVDRLAETTQPAGTEYALGIEARSRALVSEGGTAERLYREAIDRLSRTDVRPELARAHLLYGEWLRREGRRIDARDQLRTAHDMFVAIGMEAFAERTRRELLATGERVRKRTVETQDQLTPQELQIARLASDGRTNPEIGAHLFLSRRTVEWHLRKVFDKLEVRSRRELPAALQRAARAASR
jgi:DNA-binding CsgD family transcriptional regulator/tetratricopeptide (TPR) repeat protein